MRRFILATLVLSVGVAVIATVGSATATVKGRNGKIAFRRFFNDDHSRGDMFAMNHEVNVDQSGFTSSPRNRSRGRRFRSPQTGAGSRSVTVSSRPATQTSTP